MSFASPPAVDRGLGEPARTRWRDVAIVVIARGTSVGGDFLAATALALVLQSRGDDGYAVAALLIASTLPMATLARLGGRLADAVDSRLLLVGVGIAQALVCALLAYVADTGLMIVLVALLSGGLAVSQPAMSALIPAMASRGDLAKVMAASQSAGAIGGLIGPVVGGVLVGAYGVRIPLLVDAATYVALAVAGLLVVTRRGGQATRGQSVVASTATADVRWRIRDDALMVIMMLAFSCVIAAVTAVNVVEIFFVRDTLGASPAMYGLITGVWTLGVLIGSVPARRIRGDDRRLLSVQLFLLAAVSGMVLLSASAWSVWVLVPIYLLAGTFNAGLNVLAGVVVSRRCPPRERGSAFGALTAAASAASLIGYAVGGLLMPHANPRWIIAGTGGAGVAIAAIFMVVLVAQTAEAALPANPAVPVGYRGPL